MAFIDKQDFLSRGKERRYKTVPIPELDGEMMVRSLTSKERDDIERESVEQRGKKTEVKENIRARFVARSVVRDSDREPMFNVMEVKELGSVDAAIMDRLFQATQELSGVTDDDVEEMVKASELDPSDDSGTP